MTTENLAAPDPHAVAIATAMQAETDGLVILFGSRAKGNYEAASDMDVLLIGHTRGSPRRCRSRIHGRRTFPNSTWK